MSEYDSKLQHRFNKIKQKKDQYNKVRQSHNFMVPKLSDVHSHNLFVKLGSQTQSRQIRQIPSNTTQFLNISLSGKKNQDLGQPALYKQLNSPSSTTLGVPATQPPSQMKVQQTPH
mmetsp:Transcript_15703/g.24109  ORF Transcript_15703/g.24109 Transcript_15703/m.24109 type:complete len:116 (-) Transcript_15703:1635-1982(-)